MGFVTYWGLRVEDHEAAIGNSLGDIFGVDEGVGNAS